MLSETIARARTSPFAAKIAKYALGSVIALLTSVIVFAILYIVDPNTTLDSIVAFVAGAVPNWVLNRRWAWEQTGPVEVVREVVGYTIVSLIALAASSLGTGLAKHFVVNVWHVPAHHGLRVILVTGAYVLVQALLFVWKFVVYERWVFAGESRVRAALRSRHQVWVAARANRTP